LDPKDLNRAIKREHYRTRTLDDILPKLSGANYFGVCDARSGYWTIKLDEESSYLTTFNTPFGRYRFLRLPFGLNTSQDIFQKRVDQTYEGLEGVEPIADDILIWGRTKEEYDKRQRAMLQRSREKGVKLNKDKCKFGLSEVSFFGHTLCKEGLKPDPKKLEAVKNMPRPLSKTELESFLGMINYLSRYAPKLSEVTAPLRELTKKSTTFEWNECYDKVYEETKQLLLEAPVLSFYNPNKEVTVQVDASKAGVGATLMQCGKPVAFASKSLTETQKAYAQIEKELYAIVFGCEKYHEYIYGKTVRVETDHKPLESIVKKPLASAPPRLQRMLLRLQKYDLRVIHVPGKNIPVADCLSRNFLCGNESDEDMLEVHIHTVISQLPISEDKLRVVKESTLKDIQLQKLKDVIMEGWPETKHSCPREICEFWMVRDELSLVDNIIFRGSRIIMPKALQREMLEKIHTGHKGIEKSKQRARQLMYWPGIGKEIEEMVKRCQTCLKYQNSNSREPLKPHEIPSLPWYKIGVDLFTLDNDNYVVMVDYYSKFLFVEKLGKTTSHAIIGKLKKTFSVHGIPSIVISDNGPQFSSEEFKCFAKTYDFNHITSSPGYPQSNGQAERSVQTVKNLLKKCNENKEDIFLALLELNNTPVEGKYSPAQLLMSRNLRSVLPISTKALKPRAINSRHFAKQLNERQLKQKSTYDVKSKQLSRLHKGERVQVQQPNGIWKPAVVVNEHSDRSYQIKTDDGNVYRRNRVQLKQTYKDSEMNKNSPDDIKGKKDNDPTMQQMPNQSDMYKTRSGRHVKPPERYEDIM
jgi:hypothetical protein